MKLKYIMNTEMWIVGEGVFKKGQIVDEKDPKKVERLLKSGMFREIKQTKPTEQIEPIISIKSTKPKKKRVKKSKKKGVDK